MKRMHQSLRTNWGVIVLGLLYLCGGPSLGAVFTLSPAPKRIQEAQVSSQEEWQKAKKELYVHLSRAPNKDPVDRKVRSSLIAFAERLERDHMCLKERLLPSELPNGDVNIEAIFDRFVRSNSRDDFDIFLSTWRDLITFYQINISPDWSRWVVELGDKMSDFSRSLFLASWWATGSGGENPHWQDVDLYCD